MLPSWRKKIKGLLAGTLLLTLTLFPPAGVAAAGALGSEAPVIYCAFAQDGASVDGNALTAGTYEVSFVLKGMASVSVLQLYGEYDEGVVTSAVETGDLTERYPTMVNGMNPSVFEGGKLALGFCSVNDDHTAIDSEGTVLAVFSVAISSEGPVDFADLITVSDDAALTFLAADYGDGDGCYCLTPDEGQGRYPLTVDLSPELPAAAHAVSGNIVVMTTTDGQTNGNAAYGSYILSVYTDAERTQLVTEEKSDYSAEGDVSNAFTLAGLADGTYYATVSSEYSLAREDVTIVIDGADVTDAQIPVIACDFDQNGSINTEDVKKVQLGANGTSSAPYADLDANQSITTDDVKIVQSFASASSFTYPALELR